MVAEGHIVGNHTSKHPSMPSRTGDINAFNREFEETENALKEVTGIEMPKFFRPPMGEFSEKSLYLTQKLGYKSIFWSFAHMDWEVNNQPTVEETVKKVMTRSHNGEIMLLHAVSKSNTEAMDTIIKRLQAEGYRFGELYELK
jgi:peptidoglycan-N-acetylmuramic acid deacetylase